MLQNLSHAVSSSTASISVSTLHTISKNTPDEIRTHVPAVKGQFPNR